MTTESSQNQDFTRKHPSEGMDALEKEAKLPLNGWENEVARAKEYGLETENHFDPKNDDLADWFSGSPDWVRRS